MYSIENQYLKIEVSSLGAELQSIFDKEMKQEVLWQGDKKYWEDGRLFCSQCRKTQRRFLHLERKEIFYKTARVCKRYEF